MKPKSFSLRLAINGFCQKRPGFGIPRLMLVIVAISAAVYLFVFTLLTPEAMSATLGMLVFHPGLIMRGQVWRLVTWVFLPVNSTGGAEGLFFTAIALYFYYYIGNTLEQEWGAGKFTIYYLFGMALHIAYGFVAYYVFGGVVFIYPMYLNLSLFFAFAVLYPDHAIRLFLIIPIKIKWLALLNAVFFVFGLISGLIAGRYLMALMPVVALLNFFLICGDDLLEYLSPYFGRVKSQTSAPVINFKREAKKVKRDLAEKPYRHKCAVCGKTDTEFPEVEYRYCSQCNGYHCFCSEHINNHIHFK